MIAAFDLPPNLSAVIVALIVSGVGGAIVSRANRRHADRRAEEVKATVEKKGNEVTYQTQNGGLRRSLDEMLIKVNDIDKAVRSNRHQNEAAHKELMNQLETHFLSWGHPEQQEWLMRVIGDFQGEDGMKKARMTMQEVMADFRQRALDRETAVVAAAAARKVEP